MLKKKNILILLVVFGLAVLVYLLLSSESADKKAVEDDGKNEVSTIAIEYTSQMKDLVADYRQIIFNNELDIEKIEAIKNSILGLTVPAQYKDLHVQVILALIKMEEFIKGGSQNYKAESNNLINEALANNNWLETK